MVTRRTSGILEIKLDAHEQADSGHIATNRWNKQTVGEKTEEELLTLSFRSEFKHYVHKANRTRF